MSRSITLPEAKRSASCLTWNVLYDYRMQTMSDLLVMMVESGFEPIKSCSKTLHFESETISNTPKVSFKESRNFLGPSLRQLPVKISMTIFFHEPTAIYAIISIRRLKRKDEIGQPWRITLLIFNSDERLLRARRRPRLINQRLEK